MAGILNAKTRILDLIMTPEGRQHMANGELRLKFYSFTDAAGIYDESTIVSGTNYNASDRFILEAGGLPQDQITFEVNDGGKLVGFPASGSERFAILEGQIFSGSRENARILISGSQFASLSKELLSGSINAFKNQMILKSPDPADKKERIFLVGPKSFNFSITDRKPFLEDDIKEAKVDHIESLYQDKKLSHIPNFKFLPPVNKARIGTSERVALGEYVSLKQPDIQTLEDLNDELRPFIENGYSKTVNFTETSRENNLLCQFFEVGEDQIKKLDVIDFGSFPDTSLSGSTKHVFFAGKLFIDDLNTHTFVNMFTIIFEN